MKRFLRCSATLAVLLSSVPTTARANCASEFSISTELLLCAEAFYGRDVTFDGNAVWDVTKNGITLDTENARTDGFSIFDSELPTPDDMISPFFADASLNFVGEATAATEVTTRHSSDVQFTQGSIDYDEKDARVFTQSQVKLVPNGVNDLHLSFTSNFKLRDVSDAIGVGGAAHSINVSITNQSGSTLYSFNDVAVWDSASTSEPFFFGGTSSPTATIQVDPSDGAAYNIAVAVEGNLPVDAEDQELFVAVRTQGSLFASDFMSGDPTDGTGWLSESPSTTVVTVSSTTPGGSFDIVGFEPPLVPMPDLNMDGAVDIFDLAIVSENWNTSGTPGFLTGDANKDGVVDIFDVALISENWNPAPSGASSVPEPMAFWMLLLGLAGLSLRRRHGPRFKASSL